MKQHDQKMNMANHDTDLARRKLLFSGGALGLMALPMLGNAAECSTNRPVTTNSYQTFSDITAIAINEIVWFEHGWSASNSAPGFFKRINTPSISDDGGILIKYTVNGVDYWLLRLLDANPTIEMWADPAFWVADPDSAWNAAVAKALQYLVGTNAGSQQQLRQAYFFIPLSRVLEFADNKTYAFQSSITITNPTEPISLIGGTNTKFEFQSDGICIQASGGTSQQEGEGLYNFKLKNFIIKYTGGSTGAYGLKLVAVNEVELENLFISGFEAQLDICNAFLLRCSDGKFITKQSSQTAVSISCGENYANSNIQFVGGCIGGEYDNSNTNQIKTAQGFGSGVVVQIANFMDNLRFDGVNFATPSGKAAFKYDATYQGVVYLNKVCGVTFNNCDFYKRSAGGVHIDVKGIMGLSVRGCGFVDASNHITIQDIRGFAISQCGFSGGTYAIIVDTSPAIARSYGILSSLNVYNGLVNSLPTDADVTNRILIS